MNAAAFERLDALPRERLGLLPTPLVDAPEVARAIGMPGLRVKHDELIGFGFGGNKVRGLELLLADARALAADVLVTGAGPQSNHVRATAAAAAFAGMGMIAVYWGDAPPQLQGNLFVNTTSVAFYDPGIQGGSCNGNTAFTYQIGRAHV